MRVHLALLLAALLIAPGFGWAKAARKSQAAKRSATRKAPAHKGAASGKTSARRSARKSRGRSSASSRTRSKGQTSTWRSRQTTPEPERYREIQQALADKGYLEGSPTGNWDRASIDALRRFQQEQNLQPSGKINSLSLIALGLGPKYDQNPPALQQPEARTAEPETPAAQP